MFTGVYDPDLTKVLAAEPRLSPTPEEFEGREEWKLLIALHLLSGLVIAAALLWS
ncbi:MAG: hypothetical protein NTX73_08640 [Rhodobacterales bacterium]|nr:hypothetical protein [Rhodobacterales bacterium]